VQADDPNAVARGPFTRADSIQPSMWRAEINQKRDFGRREMTLLNRYPNVAGTGEVSVNIGAKAGISGSFRRLPLAQLGSVLAGFHAERFTPTLPQTKKARDKPPSHPIAPDLCWNQQTTSRLRGLGMLVGRDSRMRMDARQLFATGHAKRLLGLVGRWSWKAVWIGLALIGFLNLTRGTAVRHVEGIGADGAPIAVSEPQFPLNATMLTGAWLAPGNRIDIALNGDGTYPRLWEDLRSAERSITLQVYYGGPGRMARELGQILRDRAAAGVRVRVLYDAFGTSDIPSNQLDVLRAAGVLVEPFRPIRLSELHLVQHRSHVRGIVIDGRIAWTGGFGIDDKWFGDGHTSGSWRETNVRFEGPAVRQLQAAFTAAWSEATGILETGRPTLRPFDDGAKLAGLLYTAPTMGSTAAERFLAVSIAGARKTLYVTNSYFASGRSFIDMFTAAARRGVDVRILTAGPQTDVKVVRWAVLRRETSLILILRSGRLKPTDRGRAVSEQRS